MPPPNVTAVLHAGHGLTYTIQDVLIRFERMRGRKTLWVPGTDHAGIATQNVVEKLLATRGQTRFDVGRDAFVDHVRQFVAETGGAILEQLKALGASCDWTRTYYTLDPALSRAVREVFVQLHEKGLVYRGKYIVNWCPRCLTTLSNEEVEKEERDGQLWHLRYPLADQDTFITVATTRPETMLGDTGIAVHPDDERYRELVGRMVRLPLVDRLIPIVADRAVDPEFGSGAVKVTPAHDPLDFDIGQRAGLATIDIFTPDARTNENVPERFRGSRPARRAAPGDRRTRARRIAGARRAAPPCRRTLLSVQHRGRAALVGPMVRADAAAGGPRHRGAAGRRVRAHSRSSHRRAPPLAREPARLVHLAAAVVGPPDSGLVLRIVERGLRARDRVT